MFFRKDSSHSEPERISSVPDSIVNTINIGTQNINVNMLLAEQTRYTQNFDKIYAKLNKTGWKYLRDVEANINNPSQYERLRNAGVRTAWRYERESIKLGGRGSENWTRAERAQILKRKSLEGAEGHHLMNVHDHPDFMAEASNIKIYRTKDEHLQKGHGGDFHNESDMPFIHKDLMLIKDFNRGMLKREMFAAGTAAIAGFTVSASITLMIELANNGLTVENLKESLQTASIEGLKGAGCGVLYYGGFRLGGEVIESTIPLMHLGPRAANLIKTQSAKMAILGGAIIVADSIWQTTKDINNGEDITVALQNTAKKQALPVALLALTVYNAPAGLIASIGSIGYSVFTGYREQQTLEKVHIHQMDFLYEYTKSNL